jgi:hypothetical protein
MATKFLVPDGKHLPYTDEDGKPDHHLMGAAWAALHGGYRGNKYEGADKQKAIERLKAIYKEEKMDTPGDGEHSESKLADQWIEIFHAGNFGSKGAYTEQDLDEIVNNYDPSFHEAPAVIGHPENDAPAYAWVEGVKRQGASLLGKLKQVEPSFERMVQDGLFKKRSIALYRGDKGLSLRHVGFLGAQPPEVKGLADVRFVDNTEVIEITFEEGIKMADDVKKTIRESIREYFAELLGEGKTSPKTFSEEDVKKIAAEAATAATTTLATKVTELEGKLTKQTTEFAEGKKKLAAADTKAVADAAIDKLRKAGRWLPAFNVMHLDAVFAELAKTTETIEFGEGDKKEKKTPLELMTAFMEGLKKFVPEGTVVASGVRTEFAEAGVKITAGRNAVDGNSVQLTALAKKRQSEKKITFSEALEQVARENPTLTQPGAAAGGAV